MYLEKNGCKNNARKILNTFGNYFFKKIQLQVSELSEEFKILDFKNKKIPPLQCVCARVSKEKKKRCYELGLERQQKT